MTLLFPLFGMNKVMWVPEFISDVMCHCEPASLIDQWAGLTKKYRLKKSVKELVFGSNHKFFSWACLY